MSKVLFITDNANMISAWQDAFLLGGHRVDIAITGEEAIKRAVSGSPDLIIIDENDPAKDSVVKHLKQEPGTSLIPLIYLKVSDITRVDIILKRIDENLIKKRIIIAEDDRQMAGILKAVLESRNYEIKTTFDGAETLKEIKAWKPHLVVLDIMLPVIDGFHICQNINEDHLHEPKPKILIISGRESDWDKNLGQACGVEGYLVKPFDNLYFLHKVQDILNS